MAEEKIRKSAGYGVNRAVRASFVDLALIMLLPVILTRLIGVGGAAVFSLRHFAAIMSYIAGELLWERPTYRSARLLMKSEKYGEAVSYTRHLSVFGFFAGAIFSVVVAFLHPVVYGEAEELVGGVWTVLLMIPGIAFMSASAAIKGYLRARGALTGIFAHEVTFRILILVLPCVLGVVGARTGIKVDALLMTEHYDSVYGAVFASVGMSLAMFASWLVAAIAMFFFQTSDNLVFSKRAKGSGFAYLSADGLVPILFLSLILFDAWRFFSVTPPEGETMAESFLEWGRFYGLTFSPALVTACLFIIPLVDTVHKICARFQRGDSSSAIDRFAGLIRRCAILTLPATAFIFALSGALVCIITGKPDESAELMLRVEIPGAPLIAFCVLFAMLFKRLGGMRAVWISLLAGAAAHVLAVFALATGGRGAFAMVIADVAGLVVCLAVSGFLLFSALSYRQEWIHGLLIPLLSAVIGAAPAALLCTPLSAVMGEILTVIILTILGTCLYMTMLTIMHGITEYELYKIPGGRFFTALSRLFSR